MASQRVRKPSTAQVALLAMTLGTVACAPPLAVDTEPDTGDTATQVRAEELCEGPGLEHARSLSDESELAVSSPTSEQVFRRWDRDRRGDHDPEPIAQPRSDRGAGFMALCTYRGVYGGFPRGPEGAAAPPYEWLRLTVFEDGTSQVFDASAPTEPHAFRPDAPERRPPPPSASEVDDPDTVQDRPHGPNDVADDDGLR